MRLVTESADLRGWGVDCGAQMYAALKYFLSTTGLEFAT